MSLQRFPTIVCLNELPMKLTKKRPSFTVLLWIVLLFTKCLLNTRHPVIYESQLLNKHLLYSPGRSNRGLAESESIFTKGNRGINVLFCRGVGRYLKYFFLNQSREDPFLEFGTKKKKKGQYVNHAFQ